MSFLDVEALHSRELVTARGVGDRERVDELVRGDHVPIGVLDGGHVAVLEGAADEPKHKRTLAHTRRSEHYDSILVGYIDLLATRHRCRIFALIFK